MAERDEAGRASGSPQPANDARETGESEDPLPPEGLQLLRLIHQDFSLLRAGARDLVAPFGEYDDYELLRPMSPSHGVISTRRSASYSKRSKVRSRASTRW